MNKTLLASIIAGGLVAGFILSPAFSTSPLNAEAQSTGVTKKVLLIADEMPLEVAPDNALHPGGIMYNAMVWNGTIPGPVISIDQGDTLEITVENRGDVIHSMDFHAGFGPSKALSGNVAAGESKTWTLEGVSAGVFFYHCGADGLNGVWEHIANGMYGGIVVHPTNEKPAKEFYVVFGEIYNGADQGVFVGTNGTTGSFDVGKFLAGNPDLVLTNGMAHKYVPSIGEQAKIDLNPEAQVFTVQPGEPTRWYIVNAGPNDGVSFHFISGMMDVRDGSIKNRLGTQMKNDETWWIPPGSASVIEAVFPEEGIYVGVDHAMNDVVKGAAFAVLATPDSTANDHPEGTWVPPKGSSTASGPTMMDGGNMTDTSPTNTTETETSGNATVTEEDVTASSNMTSPVPGNETGSSNETMGNATITGTAAGSSNEVSIVSGSQNMGDQAYSPSPVTVKTGDTVTWINDDTAVHSVTAGSGDSPTPEDFDSSVMGPKKAWSHTFTEAGTYDYFCILHPTMVGTVVVQ